MNLEQVVSFDLRLTGPCTPFRSGPFKTIVSFDDLKHYIQTYSSSMPYTIDITERVLTFDTDRYIAGGRSTLAQRRTWNNYLVVEEKETNKFRFFVGKKLIYPADIINFLTEQYGSSLDFDVDTENKPVMLDGIHEQIIVGAHNRETGTLMPDKKTRSAQWHYLTNNEIFVDGNLKQLWPEETEKTSWNFNTIKKLMQNTK